MKREVPATCRRTDRPDDPERVVRHELVDLALAPWVTRVGVEPVAVRVAGPRDLTAVAQMHSRCSARSLLDRFHSGGRPPSPAALDAALRAPYTFVAVTTSRRVVATATVRRDTRHGQGCAEVGLLVEDAWQRRGLGADLSVHLAGVAQVFGFTELIAYPATAVSAAQGLMLDIGRTRMVPGAAEQHLHTYLSDESALGLGSVRERLAG